MERLKVEIKLAYQRWKK